MEIRKFHKSFSAIPGVILGKNWVQLQDADLNDFFFFKNLFYHNNCKEAMNTGGGQIKGPLFNFFLAKKCPFLYLAMLPSVSKITPEFMGISVNL